MAKNRLAGITLEIGGDTTDLSKALQQPNKEAATLQQKLTAVEQALKLDPTNVDLLSQRQRLLAQSIEQTERKLELLKTAQEQFIQSGKDIDSSEYIELEKQIVQVTKKLEDLNDEQKQTTSISAKVSKGLEGAGNAMKSAQEMTSGLSTAAAGLLAGLAATVPATEELRTDLSHLAQNAKDAGVQIDTAREAFDTFNTISGEVDSSIEGIANLLQAGFTESNLQKAVEGLAGAYLRFPDTMKVESLSDSLQETLATGAATGQFAELLDRLGVNAEKFSESLEDCATDAERQELALQTLADNGLNDTYESYVRNNEELIASRQATQDFQEAMAQMAEMIMPTVTKITEAVTKLAEWFMNLDPSIQTAIIAVVAMIAALSPLIGVFASLSLAAAGLGTSLLPITAAILGIIAAVAAAILIFQNWEEICTWVSERWAEFTSWLSEKWNEFSSFFSQKAEEFGAWWAALPDQIKAWVANIPAMLQEFGQNMIRSMAEGIARMMGVPEEKVDEVADKIIEIISSLPSQLFNWGKEMIQNLGDGISSMIGWIGDRANDIAGAIASFLHFTIPDRGPLRSVRKWMPDMIKELANGIEENMWRLEEPVKELSSSMVPNYSAEVKKSLSYSNSITVTSPIEIDLDGKPIYKNVVKRVTQTQGSAMKFKGAL